MTIGFSNDINLMGVFLDLCRASRLVRGGATVKRKIATKTRGVRARLLQGRALSATRAGIYLNLKLGNRSQASPSPGFSRFQRLPLSLSLSLLSRLFASFLLLLPNGPTSWLSRTSLIPASCRSSLHPARPSKNSLTCLGGLFSLSPFSSFSLLLPCVHEWCEKA